MSPRVKPIIFSAPMIRALLDGRKSMTRRVLSPDNLRIWSGGLDYAGTDVKWPKEPFDDMLARNARDFRLIENTLTWVTDPSPLQGRAGVAMWLGRLSYGPGDLLWCRETWGDDEQFGAQLFRASHVGDDPIGNGWRSPIHMPRHRSRLTLEVSGVKVERLQDISEADAEAEGIFRITNGLWSWEPGNKASAGYHSVRGAFDALWTGINGPTAWTENPFVVALSFSVHKTNVDALLKQREAA